MTDDTAYRAFKVFLCGDESDPGEWEAFKAGWDAHKKQIEAPLYSFFRAELEEQYGDVIRDMVKKDLKDD